MLRRKKISFSDVATMILILSFVFYLAAVFAPAYDTAMENPITVTTEEGEEVKFNFSLFKEIFVENMNKKNPDWSESTVEFEIISLLLCSLGLFCYYFNRKEKEKKQEDECEIQ